MANENYQPENDPEWIAGLLDAAFGGAPPAVVSEGLDPERLAGLDDLGQLQWLLRTGEAEVHGVRLLEGLPGFDDVFAERGLLPDSLHVALVDVDREGGTRRHCIIGEPHPSHPLADGDPLYMGAIEGDEGLLRLQYHPADPTEMALPDGAAARVRTLASAVPGLHWVRALDGDATVGAVVILSGVEGSTMASFFDVLRGDLPSWDALQPFYTQLGYLPRTVIATIASDGEVLVGLGGVWNPMQRADHLASASADEVYDAVMQGIPQSLEGEARELIDGELRPALARIWPGDDLTTSSFATVLPEPAASLAEHEALMARHVYSQVAFVRPHDRIVRLRSLIAPAKGAALLREAYALSVARYKTKYPDVADAPQVPRAVLGLSESEIADRASSLREEALAVSEALAADPDRASRYVPHELTEISTAIEMLDRAVDGQFVAAPGPLFDYLDQIGRGAIEDDPNLIDLAQVDLEPGERDEALSALEEELADDIDQMGEDDLEI